MSPQGNNFVRVLARRDIERREARQRAEPSWREYEERLRRSRTKVPDITAFAEGCIKALKKSADTHLPKLRALVSHRAYLSTFMLRRLVGITRRVARDLLQIADEIEVTLHDRRR